MTIIDPTTQMTAADITHHAMLRSTSAMIRARFPEYGDLAGRLEDLATLIVNARVEICELPHVTVEEEEACERWRLVGGQRMDTYKEAS